jgi:hypothetical protein
VAIEMKLEPHICSLLCTTALYVTSSDSDGQFGSKSALSQFTSTYDTILSAIPLANRAPADRSYRYGGLIPVLLSRVLVAQVSGAPIQYACA